MIYRGTLCSYFGRDIQVADILFFKSFVHSMDPDLSILLAFFLCDLCKVTHNSQKDSTQCCSFGVILYMTLEICFIMHYDKEIVPLVKHCNERSFSSKHTLPSDKWCYLTVKIECVLLFLNVKWLRKKYTEMVFTQCMFWTALYNLAIDCDGVVVYCCSCVSQTIVLFYVV